MLLAGASLGLGATACSGAGKATGTAAQTFPPGVTTSGPTKTIATSVIPPGQSLRGDGDADNPADFDGNGDFDSVDNDNDSPTPQSYKLPDEDDKATFAYGHPATASENHAIASIVKRYYASAAAGDGAADCSLFSPEFARAVAEDYGQAGPAYLRGATTCQAVMTMLFKHFHEQLTEPIEVVEVRVLGDQAQVVFSSRHMPASDILLRRRGGIWRVESLIGQPLP